MYVKINRPIVKVIWHRKDGTRLDITPFVNNITTSEGVDIQNNKVSITAKIVRNIKSQRSNTLLPFYCNSTTGRVQFSTSDLIYLFLKSSNSNQDSIDTSSLNDIYKSFQITDWEINEPEGKVSISAVDIQYKVINRNSSLIFREKYSGTPTSVSDNVLTDTSASFPIPETNKFKLGLKYMTLEIVNGNDVSTYLITDNTETTVTVHKNITDAINSNTQYRIGDSSASGILKLLYEVGNNRQGRGEPYTELKFYPTTDIGSDYVKGIQMLRPDNSAFPIVDIGAPRYPVFKLIKELSSFSACSLPDELLSFDDAVIKRDMLFVINYDYEYNNLVVNWFYPNAPETDDITKTITAINGSVITVDTPNSDDIGGVARIRNSDKSKSYKILDIDGSDYTLSGDVSSDGFSVGDTFKVWKGVDFIWDNNNDFKHIKNFMLGGKDEEQFNHVLFNAGTNEITKIDILGHYFNTATTSDTIKDVFIPMTHIAKGMMNYELRNNHIKFDNNKWYGWSNSLGDWTDDYSQWDFTTNFGAGDTYTITSMSSWSNAFRTVARSRGEMLAKSLIEHQQENQLKGSFTINGMKFITAGTSDNLISQWYQKGTRILFKKEDEGLVNEGDLYFNLIITSISHNITSDGWTTRLDCEYRKYAYNELVRNT